MATIIGVSGGIASGKTTVAQMLARRGARVIDADAIGHDVLKEPDIKARVVARWGENILNEGGEIDRKKVADIVFADEGGLKELEAIVHPAILDRIRDELRGESEEVIVLDAVLLYESGLSDLCDGVVFVEAGADVRSARASGRGWDGSEYAARERHQMDLGEKKARANWTVDNNGSPSDLEEQLENIWQDITERNIP